jgi:hypothetical protein
MYSALILKYVAPTELALNWLSITINIALLTELKTKTGRGAGSQSKQRCAY